MDQKEKNVFQTNLCPLISATSVIPPTLNLKYFLKLKTNIKAIYTRENNKDTSYIR